MQTKPINLRIYNSVTIATRRMTWRKPELTITKHKCLTTMKLHHSYVRPRTAIKKNFFSCTRWRIRTSRIQCWNSNEWTATFILWLTSLTSKLMSFSHELKSFKAEKKLSLINLITFKFINITLHLDMKFW